MDMLARSGEGSVGARAKGLPEAGKDANDASVGNRIRMRREALGISQGRLGQELGVTFSQIQKYERGQNRISAGRLYQTATFLGVPVIHFFDGLQAPVEASTQGLGHSEDEVHKLAEAFASIPDSQLRSSLLALIWSLATGSTDTCSVPGSRIAQTS